jgi:hypothetical protein
MAINMPMLGLTAARMLKVLRKKERDINKFVTIEIGYV